MESVNKTTIRIELHMCFDNDFNVYSISNTLGIDSKDCKNHSETRINPITQEKNCGYWTWSTREIVTFDINDVLSELINFINSRIEQINKIINDNCGSIKIDIISTIENDDAPAIYFSRDFLRIVEEIQAEIDVIMYIM